MTSNGARKLFGTDGIRAVAGEYPLDPTTIYCVGLALAHSLRRITAQPKVILGRDTRKSGPWIAATLAEGLRQAGATVESAGVITTPAVAFLARKHGFHAGVVISASHNPWQDNGIKLFGGDGFKFPDAAELAMEDEILHHASQVKIADCANGAAAAIAPELLSRLNGGQFAGITLLNTTPDGRNINANCGALHPEFVAREVRARAADLGITFDGDADRCMLAD